MTEPGFLADAPRFVFFTGKGGVGKTSAACASAIALARRGERVLLVSTDPASNLGHVFGLRVGATITEVAEIAGLSVLEIDPQETAHAYRERILAPVRPLLPAGEIEAITEQLSGSCTTEIASFNEFTALLAPDGPAQDFDHVVFDTAPTGHTIRLLQLPGTWTEFLQGSGDASCLGPAAGLEAQRQSYAAAVSALTDPERTRLVLVARPATTALQEVERTRAELAHIGVTAQHLVLNAVLPPPDDETDLLARTLFEREQSAVAKMPTTLSDLVIDRVELKPTNMVGIAALEQFFTSDSPGPAVPDNNPAISIPPTTETLAGLIDQLIDDGLSLIMCMGKGGVGKTTLAAAIATAIATRGHDVHLTTTDPAAHLDSALGHVPPTLHVSRIDPTEATEHYRQRILATKGTHLDEQGRAALTEDLRSPCTEEVAVFQAFSRIVHQSTRRFVVVDTAPTGHTLLLLDATGAYHREIARQMGPGTRFTTPLMRLRDPQATKILVITTPETTPVQEAVELHEDLLRAQITPWAWLINNSLAAAAPASPLLRRRADAEAEPVRTVARHTTRLAVIPTTIEEPVTAGVLGHAASAADLTL